MSVSHKPLRDRARARARAAASAAALLPPQLPGTSDALLLQIVEALLLHLLHEVIVLIQVVVVVLLRDLRLLLRCFPLSELVFVLSLRRLLQLALYVVHEGLLRDLHVDGIEDVGRAALGLEAGRVVLGRLLVLPQHRRPRGIVEEIEGRTVGQNLKQGRDKKGRCEC